MKYKVIAFTGYLQSGKTNVAAKYLIDNYDFERLRFAGPLKAMMYALGLTEREVEGDLKEQPCELLDGKTPRYAMQTIGTEWGRQLISPNIWTNVLQRNAKAILNKNGLVVIDDCRFFNEAVTIWDLTPDSLVIRILRPGHEPNTTHASEAQNFTVDVEIINDGTIEEFEQKLDRIINA